MRDGEIVLERELIELKISHKANSKSTDKLYQVF
jgi:hypothetical protein